MATAKFYLDKRTPRSDGRCSLKIALSKDSSTRHITLNLFIKSSEWDEKAQRVIARSDKAFLNSHITHYKQGVEDILLRLTESGELKHLSVTELRELIKDELLPKEERKKSKEKRFAYNFARFAAQHEGRTREVYDATYKHLQRFAGDKFSSITFEEVNRDFLVRFDSFLAITSPSRNARNFHLRNIRAVFNDAIDNGITTTYPFRKFSIKNEETVKRSLTVEQLRQLFTYPCEEWQQPYVDMFKLIFFLCGINVIDLYHLTAVVNGRVEYHRAKTHKLYSIKVEPEAQEIINKYRGRTALLDIADRYANHLDYIRKLNKVVQHIGEYKRVGRGGKKVYTPLFPNITTYYMRHTWATIAAELDIPFDTISLALGHSAGGARVTQVYINFNNRKIDEANRKVIDYVLYGK